jgi:hypothetical protein
LKRGLHDLRGVQEFEHGAATRLIEIFPLMGGSEQRSPGKSITSNHNRDSR